MREYLDLLGKTVKDQVTGIKGVVDSVSFDLYGCVQAVVRRPLNEKGEIPEGLWIDVKRLIVVRGGPIMERPDFGKMKRGDEAGPADKPIP